MLAGAIAGAGQAKTDRKMAEEADRGRMALILPITQIRDRAIDTRPVNAVEVLMMAESIVAVAAHEVAQGERLPEVRRIMDLAGTMAQAIANIPKTEINKAQQP